MAYREAISSQDVKSFLEGATFFWNIHNSVGYGCKNNRSDVMLVQFLLNNWNRDDGFAHVDKLVEDGIFGGKTWRAIKEFQSTFSDGYVTHVDGSKLSGSKSFQVYTIIELNYMYLGYRKPYYADIRRDPLIPKFLLTQLTGMPEVL